MEAANTFDPTASVQRVYWSKNFKLGLPFSTASHDENPKVDRLLEAAAVEPNIEKRALLWDGFILFLTTLRHRNPSGSWHRPRFFEIGMLARSAKSCRE